MVNVCWQKWMMEAKHEANKSTYDVFGKKKINNNPPRILHTTNRNTDKGNL